MDSNADLQIMYAHHPEDHTVEADPSHPMGEPLALLEEMMGGVLFTQVNRRDPMTRKQMLNLAQATFAGEVIWAHIMPEHDFTTVFMPITSDMVQEDRLWLAENCQTFYAHLTKHETFGRAVNFLPTFSECNYLLKAEASDFAEICKKVEETQAALETIVEND